jgi:hypothetical protein
MGMGRSDVWDAPTTQSSPLVLTNVIIRFRVKSVADTMSFDHMFLALLSRID